MVVHAVHVVRIVEAAAALDSGGSGSSSRPLVGALLQSFLQEFLVFALQCAALALHVGQLPCEVVAFLIERVGVGGEAGVGWHLEYRLGYWDIR